MNFKEIRCDGVNWINLAQEDGAGSCECGNKGSGFIRSRELMQE